MQTNDTEIHSKDQLEKGIENEPIYTISEINQLTRSLLEKQFPAIWVQGELSNFSSPASGHWYFSLKDANAQLSCAMFVYDNRKISFQPENGLQVLVRGRLSLYPERGQFQLIANDMQETGEGQLRLAFERLKQKLAKEGLFDEASKQSIPNFPNSLGIITSPTGAAIHDVIDTLKRRYPLIKVIVYPCEVQGAKAADTLVKAIQLANQQQQCEALLLVRGGGSLEDLFAFNEEPVARAMFASRLPIISGVGHAIDFTIADFVADLRAPTPTAAAELASPDQEECKQILDDLQKKLLHLIKAKLMYASQSVDQWQERLCSPKQYVQRQSSRLAEQHVRLTEVIQRWLTQEKDKQTHYMRMLHAYSPLATLDRGYAIAMNEHKQVVLSAKQVQPDERLFVRLAEGSLTCKVEKTTQNQTN